MTPTQLEHLRKIDAQLERLLELAEKRTPGEWKDYHEGSFFACDALAFSFVLEEASSDANSNWLASNCDRHDATFIASCAGNAEAGWKATRATISNIEGILSFMEGEKTGIFYEQARSIAQHLMFPILTAFPLESLKP